LVPVPEHEQHPALGIELVEHTDDRLGGEVVQSDLVHYGDIAVGHLRRQRRHEGIAPHLLGQALAPPAGPWAMRYASADESGGPAGAMARQAKALLAIPLPASAPHLSPRLRLRRETAPRVILGHQGLMQQSHIQRQAEYGIA